MAIAEVDKEIIELEEHVSKSLTEIAKDLELKYRDFVPDFLGLADCQEKIRHLLKDGIAQLKDMETSIDDLEKTVVKIENEAPRRKQQVVQDLINRLGILNEMEQNLKSLWLLSDDLLSYDPLENARIILRLEGLCKSLEPASQGPYFEIVNDRILPLMFTEIQSRRAELGQYLNDFYKDFLKFHNDDRVSPPVFVMSIFYPNVKIASDNLTALRKMEMLDEQLGSFVDVVWEQFCTRIIYSNETEASEAFVKIQMDKFAGHTIGFSIRTDGITSDKPDPIVVFRELTRFFEALKNALKGIRVEDRALIELFGEKISEQLISALEKGCLTPSIPFEKSKASVVYKDLVLLTQNFLQFLKENGFFAQSHNDLFENFFNNFERVSVDRRCHHFITSARELIKQPYIELIEVGSATDDQEEKMSEIVQQMEDKFTIRPTNADLPTSAKKWDKHFTKSMQFQCCKISISTLKLVELLLELLTSAAEADSDMEASRLLTTSRNVLEMFINIAPDYHKQALGSVPQIAAIFFNNCHYICHRLITLPKVICQNLMKNSKISEQDCSFTDMFAHLRTLSANILEQHIVHARRQLSATVGENDLFYGLNEDKINKRTQKILNSCLLQIEQTSKVLGEVMPKYIMIQSVGAFVTHLMALMIDNILHKEDIASTDAEIMAGLLSSMVERLKTIMMFDDKPMIQKVCEESYYRLLEIIFCLKGNLAEIEHRWCEGKGPLANWLKASQVRQLIRALFQNTERRAYLLSQIN